jgi:hypothetical protein
MTNLDVEYIEQQAVPPEVQRRVLAFLNDARRVQDLTRLEPAGVDNDLGQRILRARDSAGAFGFTNLRQLVDIEGLLRHIFDEIIKLFGPLFRGQWSVLYDTQLPDGTVVSVAHAALLHTGRVLFFQEANSVDTILWDPTDETNPLFEFPASQPTDFLFCSGHSFLSDGQLLVAGGGGGGPANVNRAWKFDPVARTWTRTASDMAFARWYPTVLTLGDERRALVVGGLPDVGKVELYDEFSDSFTTVTLPAERTFPQLYPGLHLLPGGEVFYTRTGFGFAGPGPGGGDPTPGTPYLRLDGPASGEWIEIASQLEHADRVRGMSVILLDPCDPTVRVMIVGGGSAPGAETVEIITLSTLNPTWDMPMVIPGGSDRRNVNAVLLPDGSVLVCGGTTSPSVPCARFDPSTDTWSEMAPVNYRKQYHSVAILLPSGKVMATGGGAFGGGSTAIEVFSPPYLFRGPRPAITAATDFFHHGQTFDVETPQAADIHKVVLVRPMAVTHQTDTEQRVIQMQFARVGTTLKVQAPDHHHPHGMAPRGYYLLFIVDDKGVPSEGRFVFLH